jgi:predicted nucleotidyltransferase
MNLTLKKVKEVIKKNETELRDMGVKSLSVFGSVVRGDSKPKSDINILVEFEEGRAIGLFELFDLRYFLEEKLKRKVDLGTPQALHPRLRDSILKQAVRVA